MDLRTSEEKAYLLRRVGTVVIILILIAFPLYLLYFKDIRAPSEIPQPIILDPQIDTDYVVTDTTEDYVEETLRPRIEERRPPIVGREEVPPPRREEEIVPRERAPLRPNIPTIAGDESLVFPITQERELNRREYKIQNTGRRELRITSISITGEQANEFNVLSSPPLSIRPSASETIHLEFNPSTPGEKKAVLRIESNDAQRNPYLVELIGLSSEAEAIDQVVDELFRQGTDYFNERRFDAAEQIYSNVLDLDPYYASAHLMRGRSRFERGNYLAAIGDFDNVLKFRLAIPRADRERIECITLYFASLALTEHALRSDSPEERSQLKRPALGRWEDFIGVCKIDSTLIQNAHYWVDRLQDN